MNADMLNRGTEDRPSLSLSLFFFLRGPQRPFLPPLDPQLIKVPFNSGLTVYLTLLKKKIVTRRR